jgi:hypothetical protein
VGVLSTSWLTDSRSQLICQFLRVRNLRMTTFVLRRQYNRRFAWNTQRQQSFASANGVLVLNPGRFQKMEKLRG